MAGALLIVGARVIDGTGAAALPEAELLIEGEQIAAVGPTGQIARPSGVEVVDATGLTIIPGIIEGHAHVGGDFQGQRTLRRTLQRGITTVCSVSANLAGIALRDAIAAGQVRGCARLIAGCIVTPTNGHVRFRDADGPWEVRKAVREMVQAGADFIKTAASGGFWGRNEVCAMRNYTLEELQALVDEAHAWMRPVVVHCHTQPGLDNCIRADVDQIHHGAFIDAAAVRGIHERGLVYMPTLSVTCQRNIDALSDQPWQTVEMSKAQPIHRAGVRRAQQLGVRMAVGTDYPGTPKTWRIGDRTLWELLELQQCGLSPLQALVAATRGNAEAYGKLAELGTLEAGKRADLVALQGDPLADLWQLYDGDNIRLVLKDGRVEYATGDYLRHYRLRED